MRGGGAYCIGGMRVFRSEFFNDYTTYSFGYCEYAEPEDGESVDPCYDAGFLPYSGDTRIKADIFYRARSLRVDLERMRFDKKRRYQQRAVERETVEFRAEPKDAFLKRAGRRFRADAIAWIEQRFEQAYLNDARLDYVLEKDFLNTVLCASLGGRPVAYALVCRWEEGFHFWYSFYDSARHTKLSLGKWLRGRALEWGRGEGLRHGYLGTGYGAKSAYKTQGIEGASFHDGNAWVSDKERLTYLQQRDALRPALRTDLFKEGLFGV